jgi:hypothetical protein
MARRVRPVAFFLAALFTLSGCGLLQREERAAWRAQAEKACMAEGRVRPSAYVRELAAIDGPGICGMEHPLRVAALKDGTIALDKSVVMDCPMVEAIQDWLDEVVQPAALKRFGVAVSEIDVFGAYSCRSIDNMAGARLSEHAFGNALDVSGFGLADGRKIVILRDWRRTDTQEAAFLREAEGGACGLFRTVLAPGADAFHYNHIHLDLAMHGRSDTGLRRYCRPKPSPDLLPPPPRPDGLPPAPDVEEPMDVSSARPRRAPARFASAPVELHGPNFAFPEAAGARETELIAPVLPPEGVDRAPTSASAASDDE